MEIADFLAGYVMIKVRENHHFPLNFEKKINFIVIFTFICDSFFEQDLSHLKVRHFAGWKKIL